MQIIHTGLREDPAIDDAWRRAGIAVGFMRSDMLVDAIRSQLDPTLSAEVFVCLAYPEFATFLDKNERPVAHSFTSSVRIAEDLRRLPNDCAMRDGRKWNAVPFLVIPGAEVNVAEINERVPQGIQFLPFVGHPGKAADHIRSAIVAYRQRILDELDNLGFLVAYREGRYVVGPALVPKERLEGEFYFGPADSRLLRKQCYTVDRDVYGVQQEVEEFEALLNDTRTQEPELQRFFEDHPRFLLETGFAQALPHVGLRDPEGRLIVPDFILRPVVASQRDSKWEVLELKRPQVKLLVGPARRRRLSQEVMAAIRQVRGYQDYFANPQNTAAVAQALGRPLRHPRVGVLIGRLPCGADAEALEVEQARYPGVRIVTYDEILEQQRAKLN